MTKTMRALVPAALAGALLLGGVASATAAPVSSPAAATEDGQSTLSSRCIYGSIGYYCGYHKGSKYADYGDRGNHVKEIQALLRDVWGYSVGSSGIDGDFGKSTRNAVKAFQGNHGLKADGIVGPKTWKKLRD